MVASGRHKDSKANSLAKDFVCVRRILKTAVDDGRLSAVPRFPEAGSIKSNPQPWFTKDQWRELEKEAVARVKDAKGEAGRHRHEGQDLLDFMRLMVASCLRVDELRRVKVKDVTVRTSSRLTIDGKPVDPIAQQLRKRANQEVAYDPNQYLEIRMQGKTGERIAVTRRTMNGVDVFRGLVARKGLKQDDLFFSEHHREGFKELLKFCDLYVVNGRTRNFKALRCTALMLWWLETPNVNLKLLANFGGHIGLHARPVLFASVKRATQSRSVGCLKGVSVMRAPSWLTTRRLAMMLFVCLAVAAGAWWFLHEPPVKLTYLIYGGGRDSGNRQYKHFVTVIQSGGNADRIDLQVTYDGPVKLFNVWLRAPDGHTLTCERIPNGATCRLGPMDSRGDFNIVVTSDLPYWPTVSTTDSRVRLRSAAEGPEMPPMNVVITVVALLAFIGVLYRTRPGRALPVWRAKHW